MSNERMEKIIRKRLPHQAAKFIKFSKLLQSWMKSKNINGIEIQNGEQHKVFTENIYLCPFCKSNFIAFDVDQLIQNASFSLDHYPLECVGGKQTCLVCETCNKNFGGELDHYLLKNLRLQSFATQGKEKVETAFNNYCGIKGNFKGKIFWNQQNLIFEMPFSRYAPLKQRKIELGAKIEFRLKLPSEQLIKRALLRVIYLICFDRLGYDFIFDAIGVAMNKTIKGEEQKEFSFQFLESEKKQFGKIIIVTDPQELSCALVSFEINLGDTYQYLSCVLPISSSDIDKESAEKFVDIIRNDLKVYFNHFELQ